MIAHYNRRSLALGVPGLILQTTPIFHDAFPPHGEWVHVLTGLMVLAGWVMLVVGLCYYALAKGHSKWLGLLGLLSCVGLIVLACLRNRTKASALPSEHPNKNMQYRTKRLILSTVAACIPVAGCATRNQGAETGRKTLEFTNRVNPSHHSFN